MKNQNNSVYYLKRILLKMGMLYQCPFCWHYFKSYNNLPKKYKDDFIKAGGDWASIKPEFLNFENYECPFCGGSDMDRLMAQYFDQVIAEYSEKQSLNKLRVLDIAPFAPLRRHIETRLSEMNLPSEYRTADLYDLHVDDKINIMDMSIYSDSSYDVVICSHVLEHVVDDRAGMREVNRVLKSDGQAILLVPINLNAQKIDEDPNLEDEKERIRRFGQENHVRTYSKNGFVERLMESGFLVEMLGISYFGHPLFRRLALTPTSCLYICRKKPL
jgi:SAM-dependent methyltransferase